jgi:predicted amino acid dehydrogenase
MALPAEQPPAVLPRFCFVVHALSRLHRGIMGVPSARLGLISQWSDGTGPNDAVPVCTFRLDGVAEGVVVGVPMTPHDLLIDQERAVDRMQSAVALAGNVSAVGLGSLCAVVGGRGDELADRLDVPVTNGGAATAWALLENVRTVVRLRNAVTVAVVGARSPVGQAVVRCLVADGHRVRVDHPRAGKGLDVDVYQGAEAAVAGASVIVGAGPTGGTVSAACVMPDAVVVDVAIPGTLIGKPDPSVTVLAGEAVAFPAHWKKGVWGWLYHVLSGYGPNQVFACLIEPLVLAVSDRAEPFSVGRKLEASDVAAFGAAASELGFSPRLATGWGAVDSAALVRS